jgi:AAA domain-containing protein
MTDYEGLSREYGGSKPPAQAVVISLGDVEPEHVRWLWPGRIPCGKLTLLDGDPGLGKSTVALDLAARLTHGRAFPDGSASAVGNVVILTAEDGLADTVRPRIDAMGGNPRRVAVVQAVRDATGDHPVSLPEHVDVLRQVIADYDAALLIVDPFTAFLASYINSRIDHDIRRTLAPLAALAEATGIAVILIRHLNKAAGGPALYRGGGSIGIIAAARAGLLVAEDPDDPSRRILAVVKANLAPRAASLAYRLEPAPNGVARVVWAGESPHTATALLATAGDPDEKSSLEEAKQFLRSLLATNPQPAEEGQKSARKLGIADSTLRRARTALGVQSAKQGFTGPWFWALNGAEGAQTPPKVLNTQPMSILGPPTDPNSRNGNHLTEGAHDEHLRERLRDDYEADERAGIQFDALPEPPPYLAAPLPEEPPVEREDPTP